MCQALQVVSHRKTWWIWWHFVWYKQIGFSFFTHSQTWDTVGMGKQVSVFFKYTQNYLGCRAILQSSLWEERSAPTLLWMYHLDASTTPFCGHSNAFVQLADTHRMHHVSSLAWVDDHTLVTVSHDATVKEWTITYWAQGDECPHLQGNGLL